MPQNVVCKIDTYASAVNHLRWRKSSASGTSAASNCVEVAAGDGTVFVRDTKNADGPTLGFASPEWVNFLGNLYDGRSTKQTS